MTHGIAKFPTYDEVLHNVEGERQQVKAQIKAERRDNARMQAQEQAERNPLYAAALVKRDEERAKRVTLGRNYPSKEEIAANVNLERLRPGRENITVIHDPEDVLDYDEILGLDHGVPRDIKAPETITIRTPQGVHVAKLPTLAPEPEDQEP